MPNGRKNRIEVVAYTSRYHEVGGKCSRCSYFKFLHFNGNGYPKESSGRNYEVKLRRSKAKEVKQQEMNDFVKMLYHV